MRGVRPRPPIVGRAPAWARGSAFLIAAILAGLGGARPATAQFVFSNLLEGQVGNKPYASPKNRTDFYDGLDLEYLASAARAGVRFETNHNSEDRYTYDAVTRRFAEWTETHLRARVGNFYTILGRGLLHRSFDLPGVVLDQPGPRSRFAPSRDVDGGLIESTLGPVSARAFSGTANGGESSPASDALGIPRYSGQLTGGQVAATLYRNATVGAATLRSHVDGGQDFEFGSGFFDLDPLHVLGVDAVSLPFYLEYAGRGQTFSQWWRMRTGDSRPHALYVATNLIAGPATLSAEWKDYADFRLGTNDPPSLVKEHSFRLLNRSTHVLNASRERGYQLEGSVNGPATLTLTANLSRADGLALGPTRAAPRFEERYLEIHAAAGPTRIWDATGFFERGRDQSDGIGDRTLFGAAGTIRLPFAISTTLDLQHQRASRSGTRFDDHYAAWGLSIADFGGLSLIWERTTDPTEDDGTPRNGHQDPQRFFSSVITARLSDHQDATLFLGSRRGGLACTAGTCYQVLPLKGAELRVTTRI